MVRHAAAIGALKGVQERSLDLEHHAVVPLRSAPRQLHREGRGVKEKDGDTVLVQQVFLLRSLNVSSSHGRTYAVRHIVIQTARGHSPAATTTQHILYLFYPGGRSRRPNQFSPKVVLHQIGRCTVRACLDHAYSRENARGRFRYEGRSSIGTTSWHTNLCMNIIVIFIIEIAVTVGRYFGTTLESRERPLLTFASARMTMIFWKRFSFSSHPSGNGARCADASARQSCHSVQEPATDVQIPLMEGTAISACRSVCQLCR